MADQKPVIYRATPQWFASIDQFRQNILDEIEKVDWIIPWGKTRLYNMIRDRGDWVISRQRAWGYHCRFSTPKTAKQSLRQKRSNMLQRYLNNTDQISGLKKEAEELLPAGFTHPGSPNGKFSKETDIMDVWF